MEKKNNWLERTEILLGKTALQQLAKARVYVFGLGAVGSYAVEGLARSGIGHLRLIDFDRIKASNINRQLYAMHSTLGCYKTDVAAKRVLDINPSASVETRREFAHTDTLPDLLSENPDLIIDAVDSLTPKVEIISAAADRGITVFSALGAATRRDADRIQFGPLFSATGCPLGRLVKKRLRRKGVEGDLWCVFSDEERNLQAVQPSIPDDGDYMRGRERTTLGSLSAVTGLFGLRLAHEAILRLAYDARDVTKR